MSPEVVVFDLGYVLVGVDFSLAAQQIATQAALPAAQVLEVIAHSPVLRRYESGQINRQQFFAEVRDLIGYRGTQAEFGQAFTNIFTPIEPMIALHGQLRRRGVPCFVLSNTNDWAIERIAQSFPFYADFDGYVLSYQHRAMKPDPALYAVLERLVGQPPERILYLDDRLENVQAGAARGWQVIHHRTPEQTSAAVRRYGLLG